MVQQFFDVPIDGQDYICDDQACTVVIFICDVGGVCPLCYNIGKAVRNEQYPATPPSGGSPEKSEARLNPVRGCWKREIVGSCCILRPEEIQAARDRYNDRKEKGQSGLESGVCEILDRDYLRFHCLGNSDCRLMEQHP